MRLEFVLLGVAACACADNEVFDSIVIGLGPSGLAALTRLTEKGYKVLGLEAMDRIGGRVNTQQYGDGLVEFGAEWIHGEVGNPTFELARQNNVSIVDMPWTMNVECNGGYNKSLYAEMFDYCTKAVDEPPTGDNLTLGEFITKKFYERVSTKPGLAEDEDFCRNFLSALELMLASADGFDSWNQTNIAEMQRYRELDGSQSWSWHKHGYKTLFDILMHKYNNGTALPLDMRLGTEVISIDWSKPDTVTVVTKSGQQYAARTAIVTVSLGVLKNSHKDLFNPPLPADKQEAIAALPMGVVDKISLLYDIPWWGKDQSALFIWTDDERKKIASEDWWLTQISGWALSLGNPHVISLWVMGAGARHMETIEPSVVKQKAESMLDIFYKDLPRAKEMRRTTWYSNPHTRGSYSYRGLANERVPDAAARLAAPLGRLHFAGEATHDSLFSTVHGALLTGWREADNVHNTLSQKAPEAA